MAGAGRQLHSRADTGLARRDGPQRRTPTMQVLENKQLYSAQKFSNPILAAPMLTPRAAQRGLSTKLSTGSVDDLPGRL
jgi:hypothetical protein